MRRAGFGIRLGAAAIDAAAMYLAATLAGGAFVAYYFVLRTGGSPPANANFLLPMLASRASVWLAYSLTEVLGAATPGKRILKLHVAETGGEPAALGRRLARWVLKYSPMFLYLAATLNTYLWVLRPNRAPGPPPVWMLAFNVLFAGAAVGVVGGFFATLGKGRQGLHDLLVGTVVLRPGEAPQGFAPLMAAVPPAVPGGVSDAR
jgi:uncharacterized RDD family membrane protein YckC